MSITVDIDQAAGKLWALTGEFPAKLIEAGTLMTKMGKALQTAESAIEQAIDLAVKYGGIDGAHHKAWVIDQMVRALAGEGYEALVENAKDGIDGPNTYEWDEGIAP